MWAGVAEEQQLITEVILARNINPCIGVFNTLPGAWKMSQQTTDLTKPVCSQQFPVNSIIFFLLLRQRMGQVFTKELTSVFPAKLSGCCLH